ncbi:hypothetical protein WN48_02222 [Eufriesea mexicana]|uniref:Uncharacterized protein n=1 Tax=Eufriesea mexicana TaxID=516756 RepID=A0A310SFT7_9HYME|nr:hypothetical protein WN48_02222 [Eufriesea mexicana]
MSACRRYLLDVAVLLQGTKGKGRNERFVPGLLVDSSESQCNAEFEWHTNVTCNCQSSSPQSTPLADVHEGVEDNSSSHIGTVAGIVLTGIALVGAVLYFRDPDKRACLRSCCNPFSSRRGSGRVQYCRVDTTEEARLLDVDPTQCQTDSDDDLLNA